MQSSLVNKFVYEIEKMEEQVRFINCVADVVSCLSNRSRENILSLLKLHGFKHFPQKTKDHETMADKDDDGFDYLLEMPIAMLTNEKLYELRQSMLELDEELETMRAITPQTLWLKDLDKLMVLLEGMIISIFLNFV